MTNLIVKPIIARTISTASIGTNEDSRNSRGDSDVEFFINFIEHVSVESESKTIEVHDCLVPVKAESYNKVDLVRSGVPDGSMASFSGTSKVSTSVAGAKETFIGTGTGTNCFNNNCNSSSANPTTMTKNIETFSGAGTTSLQPTSIRTLTIESILGMVGTKRRLVERIQTARLNMTGRVVLHVDNYLKVVLYEQFFSYTTSEG